MLASELESEERGSEEDVSTVIVEVASEVETFSTTSVLTEFSATAISSVAETVVVVSATSKEAKEAEVEEGVSEVKVRSVSEATAVGIKAAGDSEEEAEAGLSVESVSSTEEVLSDVLSGTAVVGAPLTRETKKRQSRTRSFIVLIFLSKNSLQNSNK